MIEFGNRRLPNCRYLLRLNRVLGLLYNPALQSENHVWCPLKKSHVFFPAYAAFTMLQADKLLLHLLAAVWANLVAITAHTDNTALSMEYYSK